MFSIKNLAMGSLLAVTTATFAQAGNSSAPPPAVTTTCQNCHGLRGDSPSASVPRLNGQHAEYLTQRLQDMRDPGSQDPHTTQAMWGIVQQFDDQTLTDVAKYFAGQTPTPAKGGGRLAEAGKALFAKGDPADFIPACQSCHGAAGEGAGAIPRLAGQHGLYLKNQLERLRLGLRASGTMHPKTNSMSDSQIDALVAYLSNG